MAFEKKDYGQRVWIADLWVNTSKQGTEYISGFWGPAKLYGQYGVNAEGKKIVRLFLQEGNKPPPKLERPGVPAQDVSNIRDDLDDSPPWR